MENNTRVTVFNDKASSKSNERKHNISILEHYGFYKAQSNSTIGKLQYKVIDEGIIVFFGIKGASGDFNLYENKPLTLVKRYKSIKSFENDYLKILKELKVKGDLSN